MVEAQELFEYWAESPPENEILAMLARVYTTWEPKSAKQMTEEERRAEHQQSLEARWKSGAMNAKQLFEAMGGAKAVAMRMDGTLQTAEMASFPGASTH